MSEQIPKKWNDLPTGRWLANERERLNLPIVDVAKAVRKPATSVRAIERKNLVIPPGWREELLPLGVFVISPRFASSYSGHDLRKDLEETVGVRHSRYWLSKQLCVREDTISEIIHRNLAVPNDWLLKLAEIGAQVPPVVFEALAESKASEIGGIGELDEGERLKDSLREILEQVASRQSAPPREYALTATFSEERGLTVSLSPNLLLAAIDFARATLPSIIPNAVPNPPPSPSPPKAT